jgi:phosphoenolpyruvate carboxylase
LPTPPNTSSYLTEGFRQLDDELAEVVSVLAEAVPLDPSVLAHLPWRKNDAGVEPSDHNRSDTAQLLSIAFELLNMVEERVAFRLRGWRRSQYGPAAVSGLWPRVLDELSAAGLGEEDVLAALKNVRVEPVLTAHPTEAKRPEVREKHLSVYHKLADWEAARGDPHRERRLHDSLRAELETLWLTGEIYIRRPKVGEELRNAIDYLRDVFPEVVSRLDRSLEFAWQDVGWSVERLREQDAYPRIRFATWIGGDRDGHPLVTPEVTANTLEELRANAIRLHRRWLRSTASELTLATPFASTPVEFLEAIHALAESLGEPGRRILARTDHEPWRSWLNLLRQKLSREPEQGGYGGPDEYVADLMLARDSLIATRAGHAAREWINPLIRLAETFGFHLAALDVRQNSGAYDEAAAELFAAAEIEDGKNFATWPEQRRRELLVRELHNPRPLLAPDQTAGDAAEVALGPLRTLAAHREARGAAGLGQLIVSMTRDVSDLLLVHVLCREAGLAERGPNGCWRSQLPVSPLFETGDDLAASEAIMTEYFKVIEARRESPQPIMVGYSDSNKDGGVFASQWGIYNAQDRLTRVCGEAGATPQFFHGRGGTIGRGAGPTRWFLRALPPGSLQGPIRITEQGEVLPRKYGHEGNAHYHLELLVADVSAAVATAPQESPIADGHRASLDHIAKASAARYRGLLESDQFIDFYRAVTPIDALEAGTFGSRPPRRRGTAGHSISDLRAIPWVFSWTQSRFYLPGWFGVGSGLASLRENDPAGYEDLRSSLDQLPFLRYVLSNVESSLASAKLSVMADYAALCADAPLRERMMNDINAELASTRSEVASVLGKDFEHRRPRMHKTLQIREQPLACLHRQQIALLREWREAGSPVAGSGREFDRVFLALQLTINAISSGLRETG